MFPRETVSLLTPIVVLVACTGDKPTPPEPTTLVAHHQPGFALTPEIRQTVAGLRQRYAKYHDLDRALADGWVFVGPCIADPELGGMGDHYSLQPDPAHVRGDDHVDLSEDPDFLVYSPKENGGRRLSALDYTIPFEDWSSPEPPELFGIPFRPNKGFGVWMFHIWLFERNEAGMFTDFNPKVPQC